MGMTPAYTCSLNQGVRNLLQGRVLLKTNMAIGATTIPVGDVFTGAAEGCSVPGANLFYNYTTSATIVQPAASNLAGAIEHQENVTLVEGLPNASHAVASAAVTKAYTTARGAYLRLRTLPTVSSNLRFVEQDWVEQGMDAPQAEWFPAAIVVSLAITAEDWTNVERMYAEQMVVRYGKVMGEGYSKETFRDDLDELVNLLEQDTYLGGTATYSKVDRPLFNPTPGKVENRLVTVSNGKLLDWADIYLTAYRYVVVDKTI